MTLTLSPNSARSSPLARTIWRNFGELKVLMLENLANANRRLLQSNSRTVMSGRTETRSGSTFDTMPGTLRVASFRTATGTPITTSCVPFIRCSRIAAGRDQKPRQIGPGARGRGAERHDVPLRQFAW